jgi:hypothetical protein
MVAATKRILFVLTTPYYIQKKRGMNFGLRERSRRRRVQRLPLPPHRCGLELPACAKIHLTAEGTGGYLIRDLSERRQVDVRYRVDR